MTNGVFSAAGSEGWQFILIIPILFSLARHRAEWADHLDLWWDAHHTRNLELARLAKLQAETLRIRQADERRAWSLDADADPTVTLDPAQNLARIHELLRALNLGPAH